MIVDKWRKSFGRLDGQSDQGLRQFIDQLNWFLYLLFGVWYLCLFHQFSIDNCIRHKSSGTIRPAPRLSNEMSNCEEQMYTAQVFQILDFIRLGALLSNATGRRMCSVLSLVFTRCGSLDVWKNNWHQYMILSPDQECLYPRLPLSLCNWQWSVSKSISKMAFTLFPLSLWKYSPAKGVGVCWEKSNWLNVWKYLPQCSVKPFRKGGIKEYLCIHSVFYNRRP